MAFGLTNWLLRRRIDAETRTPGQSMEHRRVVNPWHAVSIAAGPSGCPEVRELGERRFLASSAPMLPLRNCSIATCQCRYIHHNDRRSLRDRRVNFANPHAYSTTERRQGMGRRFND